MRLTCHLLVLLASVAALPRAAGAAEVYLNGVRVTGLRARTLARCKVRFDELGNVHITAPGYQVRAVDPTSGRAAPARSQAQRAALRYFLVSTGSRPRLAQYDVDIYINDRWVMKVRGSSGQEVRDVTSLLRKGRNIVQFVATKRIGKGRRLSRSPTHFLRVIFGSGTRGGGTLTIDESLAEVRASASRTDSFSQRIAVVVR